MTTIEETIRGLKEVRKMFAGYKPNEEMFAMAIKALETVSCIKEKCAYCPHCVNCDVDDETLEIKALEQEPCEDWYDVPSNEMTLEQARQAVKDLRKKLAEYLEQQPCEDAVSRQAVDELSKELVHTTRDKADFLCNFWEGLQKLPPVTPKEKIGHWINAKVGKLFPSNDYKCSECGNLLDFDGVNCGRGDANYCPNCGARMVSE